MDGGAAPVGVAFPFPDEPVQPAAAARKPPVIATAASLAVRESLIRTPLVPVFAHEIGCEWLLGDG